MTIAAATGLVAGGAFTSYTTVYADEYNYKDEQELDRRHHHQDSPNREAFRYRSPRDYNRFSNRQSLLANEEDLLPGLLYVALAGVAGSLVVRQRNILFRIFSPMAFAAAAGAFVLPHTTHAMIDSIGGPMPCPQHSPESLSGSVEEKIQKRNRDLSSRANEAWRYAESAGTAASDSVEDTAQRTKNWWSHHANEAREGVENEREPTREFARSARGRFDDHLEHHRHYQTLDGDYRRTMADPDSRWFYRGNGVDRSISDEVDRSVDDDRHWLNSKSSNAKAEMHDIEGKARNIQRDVKKWSDEKSSEVESKLGEAKGKAKDAARDSKSWWFDWSSKAEDKLIEAKDKVVDVSKQAADKVSSVADKHDVKAWIEEAAQEAEKTAEDMAHKAKDFVDETSAAIDKKLEETAKKDEEWWNSQAALEKTSKQLSQTKDEATKSISAQSKDVKHPKHHAHWFSTRKDKESNRAHGDIPHSTITKSTYTSSDSYMDGLLDSKDIDHETSTDEETDSSQLKGVSTYHYTFASNDNRPGFPLLEIQPKEPDYWSNGEEISSANIRDSNYYNYPGSFAGSSLGRTSWWSSRSSNIDHELEINSLDNKAESLVWEARQAAERAAQDMANRLAAEQASLERSAANARVRAEEAARLAKAKSDALIRDRQAAIERANKEMEARFAQEKEAADRAAAEAKEKAHAWEIEQQRLAEQAAKEVEELVAREKSAAEQTATNLKARAEAWANHQKEKAALAAKEIHDRVVHETAAAERAAREAKEELEFRIQQEKLKVEQNARELQERIRLEKIKEEEAQTTIRARAEAFAREEKTKMDKVAHDWEERLSFDHARKIAEEAKVRLEAELSAKKHAAEKEAHDLMVKTKLAAEKAAHDLQARIVREKAEAEAAMKKAKEDAKEAKRRMEAAALEKKRHAELAAKELEHMKAIEKAEAAAKDAKERAEAILKEKKQISDKELKAIEERLLAEKAEATVREAKAYADALNAEKKLADSLSAGHKDLKRALEDAEAAAKEAQAHVDALLKEKRLATERAAEELDKKLSFEKAEATAWAVKDSADAELAEAKHPAARSSGWSWPWFSSKSHGTETLTEKTTAKHTHDRTQGEGDDSNGELLEHIAADIKQTKEDIGDGLHHLKESVFRSVPETSANTRESVKEAFSASSSSTPTTENRKWWSSGSGSSTPIPSTSSSTSSSNSSQFHHGHNHDSQGHLHHLADHIREDLKQTKEDFEHGVESLKDAVFGDDKKTRDIKAEKAQDKWRASMEGAERRLHGLDDRAHSGLYKTSEKFREMGQEALDSDAEFWQKRAQQERRESGRAM
ncbi:hypothetical protein FBU30_000860 [Linnemannia zychae]|nr:hypothetical protein FBU30_000860 [Linnemannia zychae]